MLSDEDFIVNIPWERKPMLHTHDNMAAYLAAVRMIMGDKPVMSGLDPDIFWSKDCRVKRGNDITGSARQKNNAARIAAFKYSFLIPIR